MSVARISSDAAMELEYHGKIYGEFTALEVGDRVHFVTVDGDFPGAVQTSWDASPIWPSLLLFVVLDCKPDHGISLHRSMFRKFTILDHIATVADPLTD